MVDMTAESCAKALLSGWFSRFGLPKDITSDRGRQFVSHLWTHLLAMFGIHAAHTTAYHPQANGLVERFHRQMKASLKAKLHTSNCPPRHPNSTQTGYRLFCSRDGLWPDPSAPQENSSLKLLTHTPLFHASRVTWPDCAQLRPDITPPSGPSTFHLTC